MTASTSAIPATDSLATPHTTAYTHLTMRTPIRTLTSLLLLTCLAASAQTYTPRQIRIDAPPSVNLPEALHLAALPSGQPLTKQQIESGLQRLANTGLFSEISYTVNSDALVIKLTPSASSQLQPVHLANFVWWQPAQLESLLEASVPGYRGQLPLAGTLTDQVEAALVSLLRAKGINATVDAIQSGRSAGSVTLLITRPSILIDQVNLENQLPELNRPLKFFADSLHSQDLDLAEASKAIHENVTRIYRNAGYLDASVTPPTYSAPHKDLFNYAVDLTSTIQPGELYTIRSITLPPTPPVSSAELETAASLTVGAPASADALRHAQSEINLLYIKDLYLESITSVAVSQDAASHTVAYTFSITPGSFDHLASFDTSALTPQQQQRFARYLHASPGAVIDRQFQSSLQDAILQLHATAPIIPRFVVNRVAHTVLIVLRPQVPSAPQ